MNMLSKKYQVVIFKDQQGICRKFQIRGWIFAGILMFSLALLAGNVLLWDYYKSHSQLERGLTASQKTVQEQKTQLMSLSQKISTLKENLTRIRDFDSKLRVMINIDQNPQADSLAEDNVLGSEFSHEYLPLYRQELLARKMHEFLKQLNMEAKLEEINQQKLFQCLQDKPEMISATPSVWPTVGWVTSPFGWRTSKFTGKREFHKGLDISAPPGTPVYAPAKGKVIFAGRDGSLGLSIKIAHNSNLLTRYAHLQSMNVRYGQKVERGKIIGYVGNTGRSTGPHLHYEIRLAGVPVDPMHYILN